MPCDATLRRSGGSVILSIPKNIVSSMNVEAGSVVELELSGHTLTVKPARRTLADRLAASPKSPTAWHRDQASLYDDPVGRELL